LMVLDVSGNRFEDVAEVLRDVWFAMKHSQGLSPDACLEGQQLLLSASSDDVE